MGNGEWGLGTGDWGLGIGDKVDKVDSISHTLCLMPNAQCPIPYIYFC
ncbi:hypothetical protein [Nostoc sp. CMAA1605]|nr:hypothetical protein [Nostoc sp. CMAA1605]